MSILQQAEGGVAVSELCRELGMSSAGFWTYNNERPNMGIGGITPAMKLKTAT
jgi:hypothetical protein